VEVFPDNAWRAQVHVTAQLRRSVDDDDVQHSLANICRRRHHTAAELSLVTSSPTFDCDLELTCRPQSLVLALIDHGAVS